MPTNPRPGPSGRIPRPPLRTALFACLMAAGVVFGLGSLLVSYRPVGVMILIGVMILFLVYQQTRRLEAVGEQVEALSRELNATRLMVTMTLGTRPAAGRTEAQNPQEGLEAGSPRA